MAVHADVVLHLGHNGEQLALRARGQPNALLLRFDLLREARALGLALRQLILHALHNLRVVLGEAHALAVRDGRGRCPQRHASRRHSLLSRIRPPEHRARATKTAYDTPEVYKYAR